MLWGDKQNNDKSLEVSEGKQKYVYTLTVLTNSKTETSPYKEPGGKKQGLEVFYRRNSLIPGTIQGNDCRPKLK